MATESSTAVADALAAAGAAVKSGDFGAAAASYQAAFRLAPARADIANAVAAALARTQGLAAAAPWLITAATLTPANALYRSSAGVTLALLGRYGEAEPHLAAALAVDPGNARALEGLGLLAAARGDALAARRHFEDAVARDPHRAEAWFALGVEALESGDATRAIELLDRAARLAPRDIRYLVKAGNALDLGARPAEAQRYYDAALAIDPGNFRIWSSKVSSALYDPDVSAVDMAGLHKNATAVFPESLRRPARPRPVRPRIRVGYVSNDFHFQVGAPQLLALLRNRDRDAFEIVGYATLPRVDRATEILRAQVDVWRPVHGLTDDQMADLVQADGIDILVDLAGHGDGGRLGVFARTPAPVQVSLPGYVATTGLSAIQYRITDAVSDPTDADQAHYAEKLIRLPDEHFCFEPLIQLPSVNERRAGDTVVFGSFHSRRKLTPPVFETWAAILARVPRSRLVLKDRQFSYAAACDDVTARFARLGVDSSRLTLLGYAPTPEAHFRSYDLIDVALDPFPFNGTTTSMDALMMGVPVVALRGDRHIGRLTANLLTRVGLIELIADTRDAYVEIAVRLAADHSRRAELRCTLRDMVNASPIIQARRVVAPLEDFYRRAVN